MDNRNAPNLTVAWIATLAFSYFSVSGLINALDQHQTTRAWMYGVSALIWILMLIAVGYRLWRRPRP